MKLYTPPEMSMKLVALDCVSNSGMVYLDGILYHKNELGPLTNFDSPAFEFEDFAGPYKSCRKNQQKRFPGLLPSEVYELLSNPNNWVEEVGRGLV